MYFQITLQVVDLRQLAMKFTNLVKYQQLNCQYHYSNNSIPPSQAHPIP
jgi:hypothetical protein